MKAVCTILTTFLMITLCPKNSVSQPESYIGLWSDQEHSEVSAHNIDGSTLFDLWVWVLPGESGVICAEYKLELPDDLTQETIEINPDNSIALGVPVGAPGMSICFPECQRDWFWLSKVQILLTDRIERYFGLSPHDDTGEILGADCTSGYPVAPLSVLTIMQINTALPPILIGIEVSGASTIVAIFDREVIEDGLYSIEITPEDLAVFEKDNPANSHDVISVEIADGEPHKLNITVGSMLDSEKRYMLTSTHICAWGNYGCMCLHPVCGDSEIEFSGTVAAEQSSWGTIKSLVN